jgi:hypothetical protein
MRQMPLPPLSPPYGYPRRGRIAHPVPGRSEWPFRRRGREEVREMEKRSRRFRRPTWDDADRIVQIICKLAEEAARMILAIHGVR